MRPRGPGPAGNATGDGNRPCSCSAAPRRNLAMGGFQSAEPAISRQTVETVSRLCTPTPHRTWSGDTCRRLHSPPSRAIGRSRVPTGPNRCLNFEHSAHAWPQTTVQSTAAPLFKHACYRPHSLHSGGYTGASPSRQRKRRSGRHARGI